jgi:hypothetical protein
LNGMSSLMIERSCAANSSFFTVIQKADLLVTSLLRSCFPVCPNSAFGDRNPSSVHGSIAEFQSSECVVGNWEVSTQSCNGFVSKFVLPRCASWALCALSELQNQELMCFQ